MGALVLQHHPIEDSYNAALFDAAVAGLSDAGVSTRIVRVPSTDDLDESRLRLTDDDLDGIDHLVVVYPTWWGALPARLLQLMTDLLGDIVDGPKAASDSPLRGVRRLTVVTTHGSARLMNRVQGEPGLMLWKHTIVPLCAPECSFAWTALYNLDRIGDAPRRRFVEQVRSSLSDSSR